MTATLSAPVRVAVVVGLLAATGLVAAFSLLGRTATGAEPAAAPVERPATPLAETATGSAPTPAAKPSVPRAPATARSGLPAPVAEALRVRKVVVVSLYVPGADVDSLVRKEARAGAATAGAAYVAIPATSSRLVAPLVAKAGVLPSPAVLVIRRPGRVEATFGVTDRAVVAQAALQAKR
ncbi:MAG: hypothetical protein RMM28_04020 [Thermoleophilia bacterium]|nr:hypothetical protein [Gaiellaceae bacterium]MDW8338287.1 hypothetical protein [Thermoleophilia bacterium]